MSPFLSSVTSDGTIQSAPLQQGRSSHIVAASETQTSLETGLYISACVDLEESSVLLCNSLPPSNS